MSFQIDIPASHKKTLEKLWSLPSDDFQALKTGLCDNGYSLSIVQLMDNVTKTAPNLNQDIAKQIIRMLRSMYTSFFQQGVAPIDFISAVCDSAANSEISAKVGWDEAKSRLTDILGVTSPLLVSFKAQSLMQDRPNTLCTSRILTDIRPVFTDDGKTPIATIPIHTLQLAYHKTVNHGETALREIYISLERDDIIEIRDACNRALDKETALESLLNKTSLPYLSREEGAQ